MVVDCGGGTVDITVHQVDKGEKLIELYRATGGPYGSIGKFGVDRQVWGRFDLSCCFTSSLRILRLIETSLLR